MSLLQVFSEMTTQRSGFRQNPCAADEQACVFGSFEFKVAVGPKLWTNINLKQIITTDCTKTALFQLLLPLDMSKLIERQLTQ